MVDSSAQRDAPVRSFPFDIKRTVTDALELRQWWENARQAGEYENRFQLGRSFNAASESHGFFDAADLNGQKIPVMGIVEDRLFDHPKSAPVLRFRDELREFVLHYLLRVSDFRRPSVLAQKNAPAPELLRPLSWCRDDYDDVRGFGYSQHWFQDKNTSEIHQFAPDRRYEIADLREIGKSYAWMVARVQIFDFSINLRPFGVGRPQVLVPLEEESYIVLAPELITDDSNPTVDESGRQIIGRYGVGYAFLKSSNEAVVGYGPGQFDVAFQEIIFRVYASGEARVQLVFVANRPNKIVNVPLAPLDWGLGLADAFSFGLATPLLEPARRTFTQAPFHLGSFDPVSLGVDLANVLTGRQAERQLCISREQLETSFLIKHFDQHYQMISGALQTWREIPDWTNESALPEWVKTGVSA